MQGLNINGRICPLPLANVHTVGASAAAARRDAADERFHVSAPKEQGTACKTARRLRNAFLI